jgi:lipoprotein-releasing system ATP-binding protein
MADDGTPVIELRGVVREFGTRVVTRVLHGIDLRIDRGELAALTGPSGSGKSTLLHLMGLLDRPSSGKVLVVGQDTGELSDEELTQLRGRSIGFIFQFHHLLPAFTALENVMIPALADAGRPAPGIRERAEELLGRVGLADRMQNRATDLSGGQQQRVAVARALIMSPQLVLADEPTGNLDTASADEVFELLREINRERGTAFLVVTHDPRLAQRCRRIVDLVDGRVRSDRATEPAA